MRKFGPYYDASDQKGEMAAEYARAAEEKAGRENGWRRRIEGVLHRFADDPRLHAVIRAKGFEGAPANSLRATLSSRHGHRGGRLHITVRGDRPTVTLELYIVRSGRGRLYRAYMFFLLDDFESPEAFERLLAEASKGAFQRVDQALLRDLRELEKLQEKTRTKAGGLRKRYREAVERSRAGGGAR